MIPAGAGFRRHRVRLHAASRPATGPQYAGLDDSPGIAYAGPDGTGLRCRLSTPEMVAAEVAGQGVATLRRTLWLDDCPDLTEPSGRTRPLAKGDCVTVLQPTDARRWIACGPLVAATTSGNGAAVSYRVDLEAIA